MFEREVEELSEALALDEEHTEEWGEEHIVEIQLLG